MLEKAGPYDQYGVFFFLEKEMRFWGKKNAHSWSTCLFVGAAEMEEGWMKQKQEGAAMGKKSRFFWWASLLWYVNAWWRDVSECGSSEDDEQNFGDDVSFLILCFFFVPLMVYFKSVNWNVLTWERVLWKVSVYLSHTHKHKTHTHTHIRLFILFLYEKKKT